VGQNPVVVFDRFSALADVEFGEQIALAILRDLEMLPDSTTLQTADDLLAIAYPTFETADQCAMRRLRAMGLLIAAGEDT
jgi:hypothetical protein